MASWSKVAVAARWMVPMSFDYQQPSLDANRPRTVAPGSAVRAFFGFLAGALSVLTFHQAMWKALHLLDLPGLGLPTAYPTDPLIPYGLPRIINFCFWGGVYELVFGLMLPLSRAPLWLSGLVFGLASALIALVLVPLIKRYQPGAAWSSLKTDTMMLTIIHTYGLPISGSYWPPLTWIRSLIINGCWGLGTGVILELTTPQGGRRRNAE